MENDISRKKLLELGNLKNKKLLDVGAGKLALVAARDFNCDVTTIDLNQEKLEEQRQDLIKENYKGKINLELGDATELKYGNNSFDVLISYCVLHHIPLSKRKNFISELCRVSKEKVIIAEFTEKGFPHKNEYKIVDLEWLEKELNNCGHVEKHESINKNIYICSIK